MISSMQTSGGILTTAAEALGKAQSALAALQHPEGYWCGELTADTTLESDYILLQLWLYPPDTGGWNPPSRPKIERAAQAILSRQLPDGGFNIYPRGPADVNATIKAYCALKLAGIDTRIPAMERARQKILDLGGLQAANSYVRVNLAAFGLFPKQHLPAIPPEIVLLGNFIYQMSSWTRAIVIPLSIVNAGAGVRPVPPGFEINELVAPGKPFTPEQAVPLFSWRSAFLMLDRALRLWERLHPAAIHRLARRKAEKWILDHLEYSDGLGAIYPSMMYAVMALDVLGYSPEDPRRKEALRQFERLMVDDGERFFFQPCFSPVWDTAIAAFSLRTAPDRQAARDRSAAWLLSKEVRRKGDWSIKRPNAEPGGWYFEFRNEHYPDIDDTAMVLLALRHTSAAQSEAGQAAIRRAIDWLLAMQSRDGGWAAFDADNDWSILKSVPFADHNAMLDPTCPDVTGRVLEALCAFDLGRSHPAIERAIRYLVKAQEPDGSWFGRWGVNYIYGTFLALRGLRAAGEDDHEVHVLRAAEWLRSIQNADGGWGESCESYDQGTFVPGPSTPSQTAWAILGLIAGGDPDSISVRMGLAYLARTQQPDGTWQEDLATGTGFPGVFYLTYHLYRNSFPLMALSEYVETRSKEFAECPLTDAD